MPECEQVGEMELQSKLNKMQQPQKPNPSSKLKQIKKQISFKIFILN